MSSQAALRDAAESAYGAARWRALGTYVQLVVAGRRRLEAAQAIALRLLGEVDRACSRFRADSDLSRANRNAGAWTKVDPLLADALRAAVRAAARTDGLVDPTLGRSLAAAGYDQDLDAVRAAEQGPAAIPFVPLPTRSGAWAEIEIDPDGGVLVPHGVALDLGATGKAFAADLVAGEVAQQVGCDCVISLGGDVAVGVAPDGNDSSAPVPWRVTIKEAPDDPPDTLVVLPEGGLATSTVLTRRWRVGGQVVHHLLDPATGRPATRTWRTASVAAETCLSANTASTAAILLGSAAPTWLERFGVIARLVDEDGVVVEVGDWLEEVAP